MLCIGSYSLKVFPSELCNFPWYVLTMSSNYEPLKSHHWHWQFLPRERSFLSFHPQLTLWPEPVYRTPTQSTPPKYYISFTRCVWPLADGCQFFTTSIGYMLRTLLSNTYVFMLFVVCTPFAENAMWKFVSSFDPGELDLKLRVLVRFNFNQRKAK